MKTAGHHTSISAGPIPRGLPRKELGPGCSIPRSLLRGCSLLFPTGSDACTDSSRLLDHSAEVKSVRRITTRRSTEVGHALNQKDILYDTQQRFGLLIKNSFDAIALMDSDTTWHYASPSVSDLLGYAPEQILGRRVSELVHSDDLLLFNTCLRKALGRIKRECEVSFRVRHADTTWRRVDARFSNHLNDPLVAAIICNFQICKVPVLSDNQTEGDSQSDNPSNQFDVVRADERKRIAREIHDELGSCLMVMKLFLGSLKEWDIGRASKLGFRLPDLVAVVNSALRTVNNISATLRPILLEQRELYPAIKWLADEVTRAAKLRCEIKFSDDVVARPISNEHSTMLFRLVQEGLTNIVKHAGAKRVRITAVFLDGKILMTVEDDGKGIPTKDLWRLGAGGIAGLCERAQALGGVVDVALRKAGGTSLTVSLPLS